CLQLAECGDLDRHRGQSSGPHGGFVVDRELFFERHRVQSLSRRLCERMWCLFEGQRCPGCQHNVYGYFCGERSGLLLRDDRCRFECRRERILQYYSGGHSFPIALTAVTSRAFPSSAPGKITSDRDPAKMGAQIVTEGNVLKSGGLLCLVGLKPLKLRSLLRY